MEEKMDDFKVVLFGIVFDPKTRKILIGRRESNSHISKLTWAVPEGRLIHDEELNKTLKKSIKENTGLEVQNLGAVFSKTYPERKGFLSVYYLCEAVGGEEKVGGDFEEIKWVIPSELEIHFTTSFHPVLKEYIMNLQ